MHVQCKFRDKCLTAYILIYLFIIFDVPMRVQRVVYASQLTPQAAIVYMRHNLL